MSVSKEVVERHLKCNNNAFSIVVGGANESFYANPGRNTVYLKNRKGFVKIAIRNGYNDINRYKELLINLVYTSAQH